MVDWSKSQSLRPPSFQCQWECDLCHMIRHVIWRVMRLHEQSENGTIYTYNATRVGGFEKSLPKDADSLSFTKSGGGRRKIAIRKIELCEGF